MGHNPARKGIGGGLVSKSLAESGFSTQTEA
jgi:hypothetical protein